MGSRIGKIYALTWLEWRVILSSLVLLPYCAVTLRLRGFGTTKNHFIADIPEGKKRLSDLPPDQQVALARRIARAVDIAAHHGPYRANCLKRSLVLGRFLNSRGIEQHLKLGAAARNGEFSAHAWIECQGVPVNDEAHVVGRFAVFQADPKQGH